MDCKFSYKDSCTKSKRVSLPPTMILEKSQHYIIIIIITFDWSLILHPCFSLVNNWHAFWFTHFHYNTEKYRNGSMFWFTWYHILSWLFSVNATDPIFGWWNELISDIHNDCLIQLLGQLRPLMCKLRDLRYVATSLPCGSVTAEIRTSRICQLVVTNSHGIFMVKMKTCDFKNVTSKNHQKHLSVSFS